MDVSGKVVIITGASAGIGQRATGAGGQVPGSAELVAKRILEAAQKEPAEQYMVG